MFLLILFQIFVLFKTGGTKQLALQGTQMSQIKMDTTEWIPVGISDSVGFRAEVFSKKLLGGAVKEITFFGEASKFKNGIKIENQIIERKKRLQKKFIGKSESMSIYVPWMYKYRNELIIISLFVCVLLFLLKLKIGLKDENRLENISRR